MCLHTQFVQRSKHISLGYENQSVNVVEQRFPTSVQREAVEYVSIQKCWKFDTPREIPNVPRKTGKELQYVIAM
jgi:hypothetical protein